MKKSWIYTCCLVLLTICAIAGWGYYVLFTPTITSPAGYVYNLKPGSKKQLVLDELTQQGVLKHPSLFAAYIYPQVDAHLKAGEYLFPKGSSLASIWKQIITGRGQVFHAFTIIPGNSFTQIKQLLAQTKELHHLSATMNDQQIMAYLGVPNVAPEGMFFPDTYYYTKGVDDLVILKRAFVLMQKKLNAAWQEKANDLPYHTAYEALIAASLIEKEAYLSTERPVIAGVIVNRLQKGMLLQIDPTVIYGMGSQYQGKIHRENLLADTPYNTYVHKGLPPTPIAMPSMASIQAALHPTLHDFYYFVAKGDGSHQFSATLPEHHKAVDAAIKIQSVVVPPVVAPSATKPIVQQPNFVVPRVSTPVVPHVSSTPVVPREGAGSSKVGSQAPLDPAPSRGTTSKETHGTKSVRQTRGMTSMVPASTSGAKSIPTHEAISKKKPVLAKHKLTLKKSAPSSTKQSVKPKSSQHSKRTT